MIELEKQGIPTACYIAQGFERDTRQSAEDFGLLGLPFATSASTFTNHSPEQIHRLVDDCVDEIFAGLTQPVTAGSFASEIVIPDERWLEFAGSDLIEAQADMHETFLENGWGDGFPLIPPTEKAMDAMLAGTRRDPGEVVAVLEPGFGLATVEKIAANAVMAGCKPEHLPVIIAAVECLADPAIYLRNKAMSTGPHAPLVFVNGPIRERIGLNSGRCTLGPGRLSRVNTAIGRAVYLCMMNCGHTYSGVTDLDTLGSPLKFSCCVAENEEASPWGAYHVDLGFDPDASTVTVLFVYGISELHDFESYTPEDLMKIFATPAKNLGPVTTGFWMTGRRADPRSGTDEKEHSLVLVCPDHAKIFADAGWSKDDIRRAMHDGSRMPFGLLSMNKVRDAIQLSHPELEPLYDEPDTLVPVLEDPDCYMVAVAGGPVGRSAFFWGAGGPITRAIDE
jgi:hypothetical protein